MGLNGEKSVNQFFVGEVAVVEDEELERVLLPIEREQQHREHLQLVGRHLHLASEVNLVPEILNLKCNLRPHCYSDDSVICNSFPVCPHL